MQALRHLLIFGCYLVPAVAAGYLLQLWLPALDRPVAIGIGVVVLLGGGLLHEAHARLRRDGEMRDRMLELRRAFFHLQDEFDWSRRQLRALGEALEAVARSGRGGQAARAPDRGGRNLEEVMTEVNALKSLVERDKAQRGDPAGERLLAAGAAAAPSGPGGPPLMLMPLPGESYLAVLEVVRRALRDDRIDLVQQPIVALPQRKLRFAECFSRIRDAEGRVVLPERYIEIAEREGHITAIDNMLLLRCVQLVRRVQRQKKKIAVFCNISRHTLLDREFFGDFIDFLGHNDELASGLIFEFSQADFARHGPVERDHVDRLSRSGCRFSMDQVRDLALDPRALTGRRIGFVKIEAEALLAAAADEPMAPRRLKQLLAGQGIELIVEKIETEVCLIELLDHDVEFGQGFLFGAPRPVD